MGLRNKMRTAFENHGALLVTFSDEVSETEDGDANKLESLVVKVMKGKAYDHNQRT